MNFALVLLYEYQYNRKRKSGVCPIKFQMKVHTLSEWIDFSGIPL